MCGIVGFYYGDAQRQVPREALMRMTFNAVLARME